MKIMLPHDESGDLQMWLAAHLDAVEPGLELVGTEYAAGGLPIDILAKDAMGRFVVIEVKAAASQEMALARLFWGVAWVRENLAGGRNVVRGILIAQDIDEDLRLACAGTVELFKLQVRLVLALDSAPAPNQLAAGA